MFPHRNIYKFTWTSPDGKTHNHIAHILIERRWHSSILDVQSFTGVECDTDHFLVVAKVRVRLAVSKQAARKIDGDRFNLRELEVRKQYQIEISNRIAAVGNLSGRKEINRVWENFKESIKTSAKVSLSLHELQHHKPCFDEECLGFLDQRKQDKMQWVQDRSQSNVGDINNLRCEASTHSGTKRRKI